MGSTSSGRLSAPRPAGPGSTTSRSGLRRPRREPTTRADLDPPESPFSLQSVIGTLFETSFALRIPRKPRPHRAPTESAAQAESRPFSFRSGRTSFLLPSIGPSIRRCPDRAIRRDAPMSVEYATFFPLSTPFFRGTGPEKSATLFGPQICPDLIFLDGTAGRIARLDGSGCSPAVSFSSLHFR